LYQIPELDVTDDAAIQAFARLCTDLITDPNVLSKAKDALSSTKQGRDARVSLEGLGLNLDEKISLVDLISLISPKEAKIPGPITQSTSHTLDTHPTTSSDIWSLYFSQRICPCTVDENLWSEQSSMK